MTKIPVSNRVHFVSYQSILWYIIKWYTQSGVLKVLVDTGLNSFVGLFCQQDIETVHRESMTLFIL